MSIVVVNRIDHIDWPDIMADHSLNNLSPHVLIFLTLHPIVLISQCVEMNRWLLLHFSFYTSFAPNVIYAHSSIKHTNKTFFHLRPLMKMLTSLDCTFWSLTITTRSLRGYCTSGPYFWRLCTFSKKIKQLRTKYPMDLVRNVPRNSKITVLLQ